MPRAALIILGGFAGAGKTTVAKRLSAERNLTLISTDELNDALRKATGGDFHAASPLAHETAWSIVRSHLKNGVTLILDINMCSDRTWQNVDAVRSEIPDAAILPIILECSLETHKERIEKRGRENPEHLNLGGDAFENIVHKYEYITSLRRPDLIRMNADRPLETVYRDVRGLLAEALERQAAPASLAAA